jgi:hypothetical protein
VREALGGLAMPCERLDDDIIRDPEKWLLREQAQAMLDLFAKDCGRTPVTLEEVCEWARGQDEKHLRFRINHRLNVVLDAYENPPDCGRSALGSQEGESKPTRSGYEWIGHSSEGASATASSEGLQRRLPLLSGPAHREA